MDYNFGLSRHILHSINKSHEQKLAQQKETIFVEDDDVSRDQHQNTKCYSSSPSSSPPQKRAIKTKSLYENEFEEEDETSKRERLHIEEQERKRRQMLSEALDQFSEQSRLHRDKQLALMQVKDDANRKWKQIQMVKERVAAVQAAALSGSVSSSSEAAKKARTENDDDDDDDDGVTDQEASVEDQTHNTNTPSIFKKFSSDHDQTAKMIYLGPSQFSLPPPRIVHNSLSESALQTTISASQQQQQQSQINGNNTVITTTTKAADDSDSRFWTKQQQARVLSMKGNLREDFGCTGGAQAYHQAGISSSPFAAKNDKNNNNTSSIIDSAQTSTLGTPQLPQFNHNTSFSNDKDNFLFSQSRAIPLMTSSTAAFGESSSSSSSSKPVAAPLALQAKTTTTAPPRHNNDNTNNHHQNDAATINLLNSRRLYCQVTEALFDERLGGRYKQYPSLDKLLEEQNRMKAHADIFSETSSRQDLRAGMSGDGNSNGRKKDEPVPLLKQYDPKLLTKDERILNLLRETCGDFM